ncbi:hypothetical protein QBC47DRAFT_307884 [Echria macrotheca]|uniref:Rieske domain-containing protein n=1 Tax=Echria macrotheca TaxID=438768 RepID=A0AAJ0B611_9PEZI|nr:hypothetical protein QBC47DRAFT_307884 [Echria macrotheca]
MSWNPFRAPAKSGGDWFPVGPATSFPDVGHDGAVSLPQSCGSEPNRTGCKVFHVPKEDSKQRTEIAVCPDDDPDAAPDMTDQVLVFRFRGKFHAIDHQCPHSSYPLSKGIPFDIEDFGIVLSAGLTCPKHGWSFDLFSGRSDRGAYKLKVWETQLRDGAGGVVSVLEGGDVPEGTEVWVRRKPRLG